MEAEKRRFVGIVLGKCEYTMAIIGKNGKMSIHNGKTHDSGRQAMYKKLEKTDKVALEAGNLAFNIAYEIIEQIGSEVRVLNSAKLPFIRNAPTKTDKIVPLPSEKEMARRKIIANYSREVKGRTKM